MSALETASTTPLYHSPTDVFGEGVIERFVEKFEVRDMGYDTPCWFWTAATLRNEYGYFWNGERHECAHRTAYRMFVGEIPEGLDIDHLCRVRPCVNPDHIEPVTRSENLLRGETSVAERAAKTHCKNGHPFNEENTYVRPETGWRQCRACGRERARERYRANRRSP